MPIASFCEESEWWDSDSELSEASGDLNSQIDSTEQIIKSRFDQVQGAAAFFTTKFLPFATEFRGKYNRDKFSGFGRKSELCGYFERYKQLLVAYSEIDPEFNPEPDAPETGFDQFWRRHKTKVYIGVGILGAIFLGPSLIRIFSAKRKGQDVLDVSAEELEAIRSGTLSAGRSAAGATKRAAFSVGRGAKSLAKGATKGAMFVAAPGLAPITAMAGAPKKRRKKRS
jgi:hypothetical protein